ncbi:hypothetical protein COLO4_09259 [Corchorus olitorius]|uniref:Uncharacterized protein n=1 Tax=Corchorus olitorius TaxID=93759 RepID=A0A1R3KCL5_9ROSI|nr:hypothetical protein COLO4_09259 [Corchorus olitorius]
MAFNTNLLLHAFVCWRMENGVRKHGSEGMLASLRVQPTLIERIKKVQLVDSALQKVRANIETGSPSDFRIHDDGSLGFGDRFERRTKKVKEKEKRSGKGSSEMSYRLRFMGNNEAVA